MEANSELIKAIAITVELLGGESMSPAAARIFAEELSSFPLNQSLKALRKCSREVKGRLTLADVISRIEDGRPGKEEAWAMMPKGDQDSGAVTQEMATAFALCRDDFARGNENSAKATFYAKYIELVQASRDEGTPVNWFPSQGDDSAGHEQATHESRNRNRAAQDLPALPFTPRESLPAPQRSALTGPVSIMAPVLNVIAGSQKGRAILEEMKRNLRAK